MADNPEDSATLSEDEDWDAELAGMEDEQKASTEVYTMESAHGMVQIRPAQKPKTNSPPVDVPVIWRGPANQVSVHTSFDDFETPFPLGEKEEDGDTVFTGTLRLPPGRYLIRFNVDEEWMVDETQDVVYSLGNEYNALVVHDPSGTTEEDEEEEESEDETSDWDEIDDQLPDSFKSGTDNASKVLFANVAPTLGMVTITPADMKGAIDSQTAPSAVSEQHRRGSSVQWDPARRAFVIAPTHHHRKPSGSIEAQKAAAAGSTSGAASTTPAAGTPAAAADGQRREKDRQRKKDKKRRQKERRRKQGLAFASDGGRRSASRMVPDVAAVREEVIKREQQWREAWILHELKSQEIREKEKAEMRQQWKEEREKWIEKIRNYGHDCDQLRTELNDTRSRLEKAESRNQLSGEQYERKYQASESMNKQLRAELDKLKADVMAARDEARTAKAESERLEAQVEQIKSQSHTEASAARSAEKQAQIALAAAESESKDLRAEAKRKEAEFERQLQEARATAKAAAIDAAKEASSKELQGQLQQLQAQLDQQNKASDAQRAELATATEALAESKRHVATVEAQIAALKTDLAAAKSEASASASQTRDISARLEQAQVEKRNADVAHEHARSQLEQQVSAARDLAQARQVELNEAATKVEQALSQLANREASWTREKTEYERQLVALRDTQSVLAGKVGTLTSVAKALRALLSSTKEDTVREVAIIKSGMEDLKKFLISSLNMQSELLAETTKKYKKEMSDRRKYFNMVQELKGNIRVFCRSRPLLPSDEKKGAKLALQFPEENAIRLFSDKRNQEYEFDRVFGPNSTQEDVFKDIKGLVTSCMDGYNVCIFAYGQTGSGKTFTMNGTTENQGVNFRALSELFRLRDEREGDYQYDITVTMLEIYNETIRDLLNKSDVQTELKIHKGPNGMYVEGLVEQEVEDEEDVLKAMDIGANNRSVGVTNMNEHSSRSHSLLSVHVVGHNLVAGITYYGKLHLIDLAGSERISKSGAEGQRLKEAQAINRSLSALGNVIEGLQKKNQHVPYRDSKLTYLLQDSLGGHAKTLMFINVSPSDDDADETFCSLNFAQRVNRVELGTATVKSSRKADAQADEEPASPTAGADKPAAEKTEKKAAAVPAKPKTPAAAPAKPAAAKAAAPASAAAKKK